MSDYKNLRVHTRAPGVAQLTMARPAVFNAFDEEMIDELSNAFERLHHDDTVRVVVLAGDGKHFSAGADLQWMQRAAGADREWNLADARRFAEMLSRIDQCPKPTIARVQGAALGGGFGLVAACDIAIATAGATFAVSEARFGILPAVIGPYVVNAVGKRQTRRLALTAQRIGAPEALAMGLVHEVVGADELDAAVDATIANLIVCGPNAQREIKTLFAQLHVGPVMPESIELTAQTIARVRVAPEAREGFGAFLAKRAPHWATVKP